MLRGLPGRRRPDGSVLAVSTDSGRKLLFDTGTGKLTDTLRTPVDAPTGVAFSPDGKLLAESGYDFGDDKGSPVYVWELATHKLVATLAIPPAPPQTPGTSSIRAHYVSDLTFKHRRPVAHRDPHPRLDGPRMGHRDLGRRHRLHRAGAAFQGRLRPLPGAVSDRQRDDHGNVHIADVATGHQLTTLHTFSGWTFGDPTINVEVQPVRGKPVLLTVSQDETIVLWNLATLPGADPWNQAGK